MPGDSVSTFIDVTQTSPGDEPEAAAEEDLDVMNRAQVLAGVSDGAASVYELMQKTQLSGEVVRPALDWLSQNGLVDVQRDTQGAERLALHPDTRDALDQS